ncbi:Uncharacterized protein DBV15_07747, partial [Temnothorax longispinosus]
GAVPFGNRIREPLIRLSLVSSVYLQGVLFFGWHRSSIKVLFGLSHCDTNSCSTALFLMSCRRSWFFRAVEVSQDVSVAKALVIMFYSVFAEMDSVKVEPYVFQNI